MPWCLHLALLIHGAALTASLSWWQGREPVPLLLAAGSLQLPSRNPTHFFSAMKSRAW